MPFPYHARKFVKLLSPANNPDHPITSPYLMRQVLSPTFGVFPSSYNGISKSLSWSQKRWIVKYIHVLPITRAYGLSGYWKSRTYFTLHPSLWQANMIKNKIFSDWGCSYVAIGTFTEWHFRDQFGYMCFGQEMHMCIVKLWNEMEFCFPA